MENMDQNPNRVAFKDLKMKNTVFALKKYCSYLILFGKPFLVSFYEDFVLPLKLTEESEAPPSMQNLGGHELALLAHSPMATSTGS